ncbi:MAG: amino acid adenylation domain-containing protein [Actinobacteria bacterium]|nr:amino acid adenylation domain-containing protein [Actinomycetota bacterium]
MTGLAHIQPSPEPSHDAGTETRSRPEDEVRPPELPLRTAAAGPRPRARRTLTLPPPDTRALAGQALKAGVTLDAALHAAFAEVIRAWSAEPTFTLGIRLVTGSGSDGDLAVVVAERGDGTFAQRAVAISDQVRDATAHRRAAPPCPVVIGGVRPDGTTVPEDPASLLEVTFVAAGEGLTMTWDTAAGAIPDQLLAAAGDSYRSLLGTLGADPRNWQRRRFDLVPAADRTLLGEINATAAEVPAVLLHELLASAARRNPDAEAVIDARRRLSYAELVGYANRIGRRLRGAGPAPTVRVGELVAIVMEKGWEQYAAVYGVLTAGAAYLPIDASVPPARLERLLRRGRVRHVLTQASLDTRLTWPDDIVRHCVDTDFESGDDGPLPALQGPTDPAYVIWTSGSTGEPKGVTVDHRGVVNLVLDVNERFGIGPDDRLLAISGLHFDASIYDVFGVLAAGAAVVLPDHFERAQPDRWVDLIAAESVTLWNSVPALMEMIVGQAEIRTDAPLSSVRLAVLSGDWIPLTLPDRLRTQAPGISVVGSGGPTETICWSVFYPIGAVDPGWTSIPYGKPISNQRYYIVDEEWYQRPVHVPGQMAVASDIGLALGYWDDEERTAAQFVTLPETGERAYLTGDRGRSLPDGNIEILGRIDFQIKIQGYRIELGEIEAALREHPAVDHAVVIAPRAGSGGGRRLHGFVTLRPGAVADGDQLHEHLRAVLPRYMVPSAITLLDALPLTRNGKVDRLVLTGRAGGDIAAFARGAEPAGARRPAGEHVDPVESADEIPETALESLVAAAVADVLGLDDVRRTDNFFRLGGDSLRGIRLVRHLHELIGVDLPLRVVFDNPVVTDLAAVLGQDPRAVTAADRLADLIAPPN